MVVISCLYNQRGDRAYLLGWSWASRKWGKFVDYDKVTLDIDEGVALLRFNAPEVMNAIDGAMLVGLQQAVARVSSIHSVKRAVCS